MSFKDDIRDICTWITKEPITYQDGWDRFDCEYCCGWAKNSPENVIHEEDCIYLKAIDVLTRFEELDI